MKTYQRIANQVHEAGQKATYACFLKAAKAVRKVYMEMDASITADSVIPIAITYDGTWHRRGHSSHFGVGVIIELNTGLVIDAHVMSNYCHGCARGPKYGDPLLPAWIRISARTTMKGLHLAWR